MFEFNEICDWTINDYPKILKTSNKHVPSSLIFIPQLSIIYLIKFMKIEFPNQHNFRKQQS